VQDISLSTGTALTVYLIRSDPATQADLSVLVLSGVVDINSHSWDELATVLPAARANPGKDGYCRFAGLEPRTYTVCGLGVPASPELVSARLLDALASLAAFAAETVEIRADADTTVRLDLVAP
jgi:hypothetical protein